MRYVSHLPSPVPLLFLAVYLPRRCRSTFAVPWRSGVRDLRCTKREGHAGVHTHPYFRRRGTRPTGGFRKLSAYTRKKELGMRTPATAITVGCSFYSLRGAQSEGIRDRIVLRLANSFTAPTSSTDETATPGQNGGRRERAACDD